MDQASAETPAFIFVFQNPAQIKHDALYRAKGFFYILGGVEWLNILIFTIVIVYETEQEQVFYFFCLS